MKKASIVVHQKYVEDVIKNLHETGLLEIIDISKQDPDLLQDFEKAEMHPDAEVCANYDLRLTRLIDILSRIKAKRRGLKALFSPELPEVKLVEDGSLEDLFSYAEGVLGSIEKKVILYEDRLKELDEQKQKILNNIKHVELVKDFDIDLEDIKNSEYLIVRSGKTEDLESVKSDFNSVDNVVVFSKPFTSDKKVEHVVIIAGHVSEREKIEKAFREKIVDLSFDGLTGKPQDVLKNLSDKKTSISKEKKQIEKNLRSYASDQLNDLLAIREEIRIEGLRKEISSNFTKTNSTYIINGWVLEKNTEHLEKMLNEVANDHILIDFKTPSPNPDNPPTYIPTPRWANGFKDLLEMFATPRYNEVNPTIIMGIFFILFFSIMLGDAGYGLTILFLSLFGYFKLGKYSEGIRNWAFMGIWMGVVTTIVGFLTNSFFGDLVPRFIYGDTSAPLWKFGGIEPLNTIREPIIILVIALIFGLAHLNVGVSLGIIQAFKQKKLKELITIRTCWIPLQIGGGLLILSSMLKVITLSDTIFYLALVLVIIGIIQLLAASGPVGFFNITGYVGDWLSYARLLALGLATSGMALAFNVVSGMLQPADDMNLVLKIILIVFMIILLFILHLVNLGLQTLGAGVHSLRLQYVEFFNRFYEGGGKPFSPFKIKRTYTKIENETDLK